MEDNELDETRTELKKVPIKGFTKNSRLQNLEEQKSILASHEWSFVAYKDEGSSNSYATFRKDFKVGKFHKPNSEKQFDEEDGSFNL